MSTKKATDLSIGDNWKVFVISLCKFGATNSSKEIADFINRHNGSVKATQVAGVMANYKRGAYNN